MKKSHLILIFIAGLLSVIIYEAVIYYINDGYRSAPLDDTYIHLKFANNFSNGYFFQYNINEPVAGSTSPLWVILIGISGFLNKGFLFNAIFFSWFFYILSALTIYKIIYFITSEDNGYLALLSSLLFLFTGRIAFISSSGMETSLFILLLLTAIYVDLLNRDSLLYLKWILCGLLVNTRPEGFLLASLLLIKDIYNLLYIKKSLKSFTKILFAFIIFLILASPYVVFSFYTNGSPFPNTFKGVNKIYSENQSLDFLKKTIVFFSRDNVFVLLFALTGLFSILLKFLRDKKSNPVLIPVIYFIVHFLFSLFIFPNSRHYGRYFIPDFALLLIIAIYLIYNYSFFRNFTQKLKKYFLIAILLFSFPYFIKIAIDNGIFVSNISSMHIQAVKWINANTTNNSKIALNDIGAIGYYTNSYIIDMEGLVTPDILKYKNLSNKQKNDSLISYLNTKNADYLIIFDEWYPDLTVTLGNRIQFIHSIYVENNLNLGGKNMNFYKIFKDQ